MKENIGFFLSSCKELGLKGGQLFDPEDLQEVPKQRISSSSWSSLTGRDEHERRLRSVAVTLYWLGRTVASLKGYSGPHLNLTAFGSIISPESKPRRTSISSIKVTSRKVSKPQANPGLARFKSLELLVSPSNSEAGQIIDTRSFSPYSSKESLTFLSGTEINPGSSEETTKAKHTQHLSLIHI